MRNSAAGKFFASLVLTWFIGLSGCGPVTDDPNTSPSNPTNPSTPTPTPTSTSTPTPMQTPTPSATSVYIIPLQGCTLIDYSVTTTIGAQSGFQLIVDSGSSDLAVASSLCTNCTSISPDYFTSHGQSDVTSVSAVYGDQSTWSGTAYLDTVGVGDLPPVSTIFAAIRSETSFFNSDTCDFQTSANGVQGILGMAFAGLTSGPDTPYLDRFNAETPMANLFSTQFCMVGGNLWVGGYDSSYMTGAIQYTPLLSETLYYSVNFSDIQVGGTSLGYTTASFHTPIVDTGTTVGLFPNPVFTNVAAKLAQNSTFLTQFGSNWLSAGQCTDSSMTPQQLNAALPTFAVVFPSTTNGQTITVTLPATESYLDMHQNSNGTTYYCPGIAPVPTGTINIFGGSLMRSLITVFDRANHRIGFAPGTGCSP